MRAILHGGKFRIINMKKIIAIFSVILTFGLGLPNDGWGAKNCKKFSCRHSSIGIGTEYVYAYSYDTTWCFSCDSDDDGIGDDQCDYDDVVFQINEEGRATNLYKCTDKTGTSKDPWVSDNVTNLCSCSDLMAGANLANSDTFYSNGACGTFADPGSSTNSWCRYYKCKTGFVASSDKKSCIVAHIESDCTNSHGQWNGSKCLCGTDRTDGKGDGQTYDVPDQKCKCSDSSQEWDEAAGKCVDPDAADVAACEASGGNWSDGECKCNETTLTQSSDKKTCVRNDAYYNCTASTSGGDWVSGACKCDSGKGLTGPNSDGACYCSNSAQVYDSGIGQCTDSAETVCKKTGGVWDGTNCDCDISGKNIKKKDGSVPVQCECISPDYEWNADKTQGCKLSPEAENRKENFEKSKEACEAWGGTWSPGTWESPDGVDVTKWKCKCPNSAGVVQATAVSCKCDTINGYQETAPGKCEPTKCKDLEKKCATVSDASYKTLTAHDGQKYCECVCDDEKNKAYNYSKNKCEAITNICDLIDDAVLDRYGNCVCKSNWLPPVRGKCPSGTSSGSASGGGASSGVTVSPQQIAQAKQNVSDVYDDLKSISDGFGRSHWKTASGNFNGARLASDSIAGVVLGTVGGVVTSNVIKKNQVKGGFESLQCTVGGQLVADFADQFQVGIR